MRSLPSIKAKPKPSSAWIVTFADLMSLLLTFFILLLSFSEMDAAKYQKMVQALSLSFGIEAFQGATAGGQVIFVEAPPLPLAADRQTSDPVSDVAPKAETDLSNAEANPVSSEIALLQDALEQEPEFKQIDPNVERLTEVLVDELKDEILSNSLSVSYDADKVVVRFSSATTFTLGSEELQDEMYAILRKIEDVLAHCGGQIVVSGYTDDLPVNSSRFRSNWDLSAARAVSVVHQLVLNNKINAENVMAAGHAETNPLVPNNSAENRARNRRVEISVLNPQCQQVDFEF